MMWDQLQSRAARSSGEAHLSGDMSYEEVKDRTSTAVGSGNDDGVLFDETISAYSARRKAALEFLVTALVDSHNKAFRAYLTRTQWTTISEGSSAGKFLALGAIPQMLNLCS